MSPSNGNSIETIGGGQLSIIVDSSQVIVEAFLGCKWFLSETMKICQSLGFFILSHDARPTHDFNTCVSYFSHGCIGVNRDSICDLKVVIVDNHPIAAIAYPKNVIILSFN